MQLIAYCKSGQDGLLLNSKILRKLKILSFAIFIACMSANAGGFGQTITVNLKNAPVEKLFREIERQTHYRFVYTREQLRNTIPVNIEIRNGSLENVLESSFRNQPISYSVEKKYILVSFTEKKAEIIVTEIFPIKGRVLNEAGEPVEGLTIKVKGTDKVTVTNAAGEFSFSDVATDAVLVISGAEIKNVEVRVSGQNFITIHAIQKISQLDETIIKGYYSTSQRLNTGTVSRVSSKDIVNQPVSNPLAALQGRVPGLLITQANGLPGSGFSVLIRGRNSIQNGTDPLYIINGIPFSSDRLTQRSNTNSNSPFNVINTSDIESIEVLKDADATAIYGSRGANGVILITTKNANQAQKKIDISITQGWGKVTRTMDMLKTPQYLQIRREAFSNDGLTPGLTNAPDLLLWDTTRYTDWKKILIGETAKTTNVNLGFSTGNKYLGFGGSLNYYRETTVFPGNLSLGRFSSSFSINHLSANEKFAATISFRGTADESNLSSYDLTRSITLPPDAPPLYDSSGLINWAKGTFTNPLALQSRKYVTKNFWLSANSIMSYKFSKNFLARVSIGLNRQELDELQTTPIRSQSPTTNPTGGANFGKAEINNWIAEPQLEYNLALGKKGKFSALAGTSFQQNSGNSTIIDASGYSSDALIESTAGAASIVTTNSEKIYRYSALFGRLNLNWANKYLLNLTGRRDGSSRFGDNRKFANFFAAGVGWIFSEYPFFKKHLSFISFGKLRSSYGTTGNDQIGDYAYLDTWSATTYPYQGSAAIRPTRLFNNDYSWERKKNLEFNLQLGLFHDRIMISAGWYRSRSDNQLINYSLPAQTGFTSVLRNFPGVVQNKGLELEISTRNFQTKNFNWVTTFNLTRARNKLIEFPGLASSSYATTYVVGQPLSIIRGYHFLGVNATTGIYQYEDKNNDGLVNNLDFVALGTKDPEYYGGFQNTFTYKSFECSFLFQFNHQMGLHGIYGGGVFPGTNSNQSVAVLDHWRKAGDLAAFQKYSTGGAVILAATKLLTSDAALTDATFTRLKNISVSWQLPARIIQKVKMKGFRVFTEAQNLFTITNYRGADPETQAVTQLPPLRMIAIGMQITF